MFTYAIFVDDELDCLEPDLDHAIELCEAVADADRGARCIVMNTADGSVIHDIIVPASHDAEGRTYDKRGGLIYGSDEYPEEAMKMPVVNLPYAPDWYPVDT